MNPYIFVYFKVHNHTLFKTYFCGIFQIYNKNYCISSIHINHMLEISPIYINHLFQQSSVYGSSCFTYSALPLPPYASGLSEANPKHYYLFCKMSQGTTTKAPLPHSRERMRCPLDYTKACPHSATTASCNHLSECQLTLKSYSTIKPDSCYSSWWPNWLGPCQP